MKFPGEQAMRTMRAGGGWLALCLALGGASRGRGAESMDAVWILTADSQPLEAQASLAKVKAPDPRVRVLAEVTLIMARPPLAKSDVETLDSALAALTGGADEVAAEALYLRARLHQVHRTPPDLETAARLYAELARRQPASHWAQLGLVKLGLMQLYALAEPRELEARLRAVDAFLPAITEPALKRDLQMQIGWAALFYERPPSEALPYLIAAERAGGLSGMVPEDLVLQIGELSFRAGDLPRARSYFNRFLREFPVSMRRYNVRQRLDELERQAGKEGGS